MTNHPLVPLAIAIVAVGAVIALAPGLVASSHMVGYLRDTDHGRRSTTTRLDRPERMPLHEWTNDAPVSGLVGPAGNDGQIQVVVPENAGR